VPCNPATSPPPFPSPFSCCFVSSHQRLKKKKKWAEASASAQMRAPLTRAHLLRFRRLLPGPNGPKKSDFGHFGGKLGILLCRKGLRARAASGWWQSIQSFFQNVSHSRKM
jgi:hypothetical protein